MRILLEELPFDLEKQIKEKPYASDRIKLIEQDINYHSATFIFMYLSKYWRWCIDKREGRKDDFIQEIERKEVVQWVVIK